MTRIEAVSRRPSARDAYLEAKPQARRSTVEMQRVQAPAVRDLMESAPIAPRRIAKSFTATDARVLSIDGGGVFGLGPARVLQYIEERTGKAAADLFHMVSGTSTGGIIGAGIALRVPARDIVKLYLEDAQHIFSRTLGYRIRSVDGWLAPKFQASGVERVYKKHFGSARLSDSELDLIVTAHDVKRSKPKLFESWNTSTDYLMRDTIRATSAAVPLLPVAVVQDVDKREPKLYCIDGSFAGAANPVSIGLGQAYRRYPNAERVVVVSLGTGYDPTPLDAPSLHRWGILQFAKPLFGIISDSAAIANEHLASQWLTPGETYFRLNPPTSGVGKARSSSRPMDDGSPRNMQLILEQTDAWIHANKRQLDRLCEALVQQMPARKSILAGRRRGVARSAGVLRGR